MNAERFQLIERLFQECMERDLSARTAFLAEACGGDVLLRREVETLLAADPEAGAVLASAVRHGAGLLLDQGSWEGRRIGPYQIVREVGRGGMGVVFLAHRSDEQFEQRVAIKLVAGMQAESLLARFRQERQILAGLEHPNIARLLDGGATAEGLPYLVMEYVEGEPLLSYCDRRRLPVRERVNLFRQVCSAVQYAHQNLIVHRDLKPGNILVSADGVPKLLDFGIAKLLPRDNEGESAPTLTAIALTPHYASPEQVQGGPITTATDVYGLGAILYQLLSGIPAHTLTGTGWEELLRVICTEDPPRPSVAVLQGRKEQKDSVRDRALQRGVTPERLATELSGDLDAIVMKTLRKEPSSRYGSAEQLSGDVQRHLESSPVMARRNTLRYRAGRFMRRRRAAVAGSAALLIALATFSVVAGFQAIRIARERDKANLIANFLRSVFSYANPDVVRDNNITTREILDRTTVRINRELAREPEVQARMLEITGEYYRELGMYDRALALIQAGLRIEQDVLRSSAFELARSKLTLARVYAETGNAVEAEKLFGEVITLRRQLRRRDPALLANALHGLGYSYQARGNAAAAEPLAREAVEIRRRTGAPETDIANALNTLGLTLIDLNRYPEAAARLNEALSIFRRTVGNVNQGVASCLNNLAIIHDLQGDLAGAIACYRQALAVQLKLHGESNQSVALVMVDLSNSLADQGDYAEAEALARRSLEIRRKVFPEGHLHIGRSEAALGRVLLDRGDARQAEPLLKDAVRIFTRVLPEGNGLRTEGAAALGRCLARLRYYSEAYPLLVRSCPAIAREKGATHRHAVLCEQALADSTPVTRPRR